MGKSRKWWIVLLLMVIALCSVSSCSREEFGGLGIEVPSGEGKVTSENPYVIVAVFDGGTGQLAGLKSGDRIISVDGVALKGLQHDYIVTNFLRGRIGSSVTLEVEREGTLKIVKVPRGRVVLSE